jgi:hypothetical protein
MKCAARKIKITVSAICGDIVIFHGGGKRGKIRSVASGRLAPMAEPRELPFENCNSTIKSFSLFFECVNDLLVSISALTACGKG